MADLLQIFVTENHMVGTIAKISATILPRVNISKQSISYKNMLAYMALYF